MYQSTFQSVYQYVHYFPYNFSSQRRVISPCITLLSRQFTNMSIIFHIISLVKEGQSLHVPIYFPGSLPICPLFSISFLQSKKVNLSMYQSTFQAVYQYVHYFPYHFSSQRRVISLCISLLSSPFTNMSILFHIISLVKGGQSIRASVYFPGSLPICPLFFISFLQSKEGNLFMYQSTFQSVYQYVQSILFHIISLV